MYDKWNLRLKNVTWGYRDKFGEALKRLQEAGQLDLSEDDPAYQAFDKTYMGLVGKDYCTDQVADGFLQSLDRKLSWIISIPELMESWGNYGLKLLNNKLYYASVAVSYDLIPASKLGNRSEITPGFRAA